MTGKILEFARTALAILLVGVCACGFGQRKENMSTSFLRAFPPHWNIGDHWTVMFKTQSPAPVELAPRYVERSFEFTVFAVPDERTPHYRIVATAVDAASESYVLYFRPDYSLERVTRRLPDDSEETLLQNGVKPFIYYERRLPIAPDFPVAPGPVQIIASAVVQEIRNTADGVQIILQRIEPSGSLRVVMDWVAGDPWWSTIQCTENPPAGLPGQVVASGYLLRDSK